MYALNQPQLRQDDSCCSRCLLARICSCISSTIMALRQLSTRLALCRRNVSMPILPFNTDCPTHVETLGGPRDVEHLHSWTRVEQVRDNIHESCCCLVDRSGLELMLTLWCSDIAPPLRMVSPSRPSDFVSTLPRKLNPDYTSYFEPAMFSCSPAPVDTNHRYDLHSFSPLSTRSTRSTRLPLTVSPLFLPSTSSYSCF